MSRKRFILDTSALLTLIEDEDGADRVEQVLSEEYAFLPWVVLLETTYITQQERGQSEADRRYALAKGLSATILWEVDEPTLLQAARLKATHRVSLADSIIAAFAIRKDAILLHKDPEFELIVGQVAQEILPYKNRDKTIDRAESLS